MTADFLQVRDPSGSCDLFGALSSYIKSRRLIRLKQVQLFEAVSGPFPIAMAHNEYRQGFRPAGAFSSKPGLRWG